MDDLGVPLFLETPISTLNDFLSTEHLKQTSAIIRFACSLARQFPARSFDLPKRYSDTYVEVVLKLFLPAIFPHNGQSRKNKCSNANRTGRFKIMVRNCWATRARINTMCKSASHNLPSLRRSQGRPRRHTHVFFKYWGLIVNHRFIHFVLNTTCIPDSDRLQRGYAWHCGFLATVFNILCWNASSPKMNS